ERWGVGRMLRWGGDNSPPPPDGSKVLTKAPVVPLYSSTVEVDTSVRNRSPLGPNARAPGFGGPLLLPPGTKNLTKAPVVLSNSCTPASLKPLQAMNRSARADGPSTASSSGASTASSSGASHGTEDRGGGKGERPPG